MDSVTRSVRDCLARIGGLVRGLQAPLDIHWLTPSLAVGAAPPSRHLKALRARGITLVVDLRSNGERAAEPEWVQAAEAAGISVRLLPVRDRDAPTAEQLERGCGWVLEGLGVDRNVLICCRAGAGRSATLATAVLVRIGYRLQEAFALLSKARNVANPTDRQLAALRAFAESEPASAC